MARIKVDLLALLAERPISHPSTVLSMTVRSERMIVVIEGERWWVGSNGIGRMRLLFDHPHDGCLDLSQFGSWQTDEMLEGFSVERTADLPWEFGGMSHSTYCQSPLADPLALFAILHDRLDAWHAAKEPFDYLNGGPTLERFRKLTSCSGYLLSNAPPALQTVIADELRRQGVRFTVLDQPRREGGTLLVRLNGRTFECSNAQADWLEE